MPPAVLPAPPVAFIVAEFETAPPDEVNCIVPPFPPSDSVIVVQAQPVQFKVEFMATPSVPVSVTFIPG